MAFSRLDADVPGGRRVRGDGSRVSSSSSLFEYVAWKEVLGLGRDADVLEGDISVNNDRFGGSGAPAASMCFEPSSIRRRVSRFVLSSSPR